LNSKNGAKKKWNNEKKNHLWTMIWSIDYFSRFEIN
jgi:hypothetical protein